MLFLSLLFSYFKIYKNIQKTNNRKEFDYDLLYSQIRIGYFIGFGFIIFHFIIRLINLTYLYKGDIKNFYLLLFEYWIVGIIILIALKLGSKIIKKER